MNASVFATERKTLAADQQQERSLRVLLLDEWSNLARGAGSADAASRVEGVRSRECGSKRGKQMRRGLGREQLGLVGIRAEAARE